MKALFIHQNMPGQFVHLVRQLSEDKDNQVIFITQRRDLKLPRVLKLTYEPPKTSEPSDQATAEFIAKVNNGRLVARACELLKSRDLTPDVIIGHPGWGEMMFVRDIFPRRADPELLRVFSRRSPRCSGSGPRKHAQPGCQDCSSATWISPAH